MIFHLKIVLDIIFSGYNVSPIILCVEHIVFVQISLQANYRGKSGALRSALCLKIWSF